MEIEPSGARIGPLLEEIYEVEEEVVEVVVEEEVDERCWI